MAFDFSLANWLKKQFGPTMMQSDFTATNQGVPWYENPKMLAKYRKQRRIKNRIARTSRAMNARRAKA
jgi:hypothetical protein